MGVERVHGNGTCSMALDSLFCHRVSYCKEENLGSCFSNYENIPLFKEIFNLFYSPDFIPLLVLPRKVPHPISLFSFSGRMSSPHPLPIRTPCPLRASTLFRVRYIFSEGVQSHSFLLSMCWGPHISWCMLNWWLPSF